MPITKNPAYRYYNCNIQAPRLLGTEIHGDQISFDRYENGMGFETGNNADYNKEHVIILSSLDDINPDMCGELTVYAQNIANKLSHVLMIVITKNNNVMTNDDVVLYQSVGNCRITTGSTTTLPTVVPFQDAPDGGVRIEFPYSMTIRWVWRGFST